MHTDVNTAQFWARCAPSLDALHSCVHTVTCGPSLVCVSSFPSMVIGMRTCSWVFASHRLSTSSSSPSSTSSWFLPWCLTRIPWKIPCNSSFGSMVSLDYVTPDTGSVVFVHSRSKKFRTQLSGHVWQCPHINTYAVSPFAVISVATSPLRITLLPFATTACALDRRYVHINDALSIFIFTVYLPTQSLTYALSMALSPLWTCGLDEPAVSPNCAPLSCKKSRDVSTTMCDVMKTTTISANMIED